MSLTRTDTPDGILRSLHDERRDPAKIDFQEMLINARINGVTAVVLRVQEAHAVTCILHGSEDFALMQEHERGAVRFAERAHEDEIVWNPRSQKIETQRTVRCVEEATPAVWWVFSHDAAVRLANLRARYATPHTFSLEVV